MSVCCSSSISKTFPTSVSFVWNFKCLVKGKDVWIVLFYVTLSSRWHNGPLKSLLVKFRAARKHNYHLRQCLEHAWTRIWLLACCHFQPLSTVRWCVLLVAGITGRSPPDGTAYLPAACQPLRRREGFRYLKPASINERSCSGLPWLYTRRPSEFYLKSFAIPNCLFSFPEVTLCSILLIHLFVCLLSSKVNSPTSYAFRQNSCFQNFLLLVCSFWVL